MDIDNISDIKRSCDIDENYDNFNFIIENFSKIKIDSYDLNMSPISNQFSETIEKINHNIKNKHYAIAEHFIRLININVINREEYHYVINCLNYLVTKLQQDNQYRLAILCCYKFNKELKFVKLFTESINQNLIPDSEKYHEVDLFNNLIYDCSQYINYDILTDNISKVHIPMDQDDNIYQDDNNFNFSFVVHQNCVIFELYYSKNKNLSEKFKYSHTSAIFYFGRPEMNEYRMVNNFNYDDYINISENNFIQYLNQFVN